MSKNNCKTKFLSLLLVVALMVTMMPMTAFASETTSEPITSCDDGVHDFSVEKYDESNHWHECSVCGVADELLNHYYDDGDTICNGCSYERSIIEEISINKTLMSEGEEATITVKVIEGYTAKWIYLYKPITNNTETVYLHLESDNTYTGSFSVDNQTESGVWKVKYMTLQDAEDAYVYLYNSKTYTGAYHDKYDFSALNFEVIGTEADIVVPVIENYSVDKSIVSDGEKVTFTVQVTDDHLPSSFLFWFKSPSGESAYVSMKKVDSTGLYQGAFSIDDNFEIGLWRPYYFTVSDTNGNSVTLYNNKVTSTGSNKVDLSSLNFEVVEHTEDENVDAESFIVKFTDGFGTTLSTQKVVKGEAASAPANPTNDIYLFDGWDKDFSNVTSNLTVAAKWIDNPNATYDNEVHLGNVFKISVGASVNQTYTITCNKDIDFTYQLTGTTYTNLGGSYYGKTYTVTVNEPGSYYFYVNGSVSTNTLTYKVKVEEHDYSKDWTIDKEATCTEEGSKSHHCSRCNATTDVTIIEKFGHDYSVEWVVDKEATCTEEGSKSHHCSRCDATTDVRTIEKLGHDYSKDWTIDKTATCTEDGEKSHHCSRCEAKKDITVIEAYGHNYKTVKTVVATCEEDGYIEKICSTCSQSKYITIEAEGHKMSNKATVTKKATTSQNGKLTYRCETCGNLVKTKVIPKITTVKLSAVAYTYDGKAKKPAVTVKDSKGTALKSGTDYTVSYASGRTKIGKYKVTVTFKGNYSGSKALYFEIGPKNPSSVKTALYGYDDVKVSWSKVPGASGYKVYYKKSSDSDWTLLKTTTATSYKKANLADGVKYDFKVVAYKTVSGNACENAGKTSGIYTLKKVSGVKAVKSGSKVKVSWTNISGETGYQISRSTSKTGTKIVATYATTSGKYKTVSATKGKTYYYKVRAYKTVGKTKIYGPWSSVVKYKR